LLRNKHTTKTTLQLSLGEVVTSNWVWQQELGSGGKKADTSEEWRNQSVEDRLEYALVRV